MSVFNCPIYIRKALGIVARNPDAIDKLNQLSTIYTAIVSTQSTRVLAAGRRKYLSMKNLDAGNAIYVGLGEHAAIDSPTNIRLLPNEEKFFNVFIPEGDINAISNAGTPQLSISFGV